MKTNIELIEEIYIKNNLRGIDIEKYSPVYVGLEFYYAHKMIQDRGFRDELIEKLHKDFPNTEFKVTVI